jgi:hypothetical protein
VALPDGGALTLSSKVTTPPLWGGILSDDGRLVSSEVGLASAVGGTDSSAGTISGLLDGTGCVSPVSAVDSGAAGVASDLSTKEPDLSCSRCAWSSTATSAADSA